MTYFIKQKNIDCKNNITTQHTVFKCQKKKYFVQKDVFKKKTHFNINSKFLKLYI